MIKRGDGEMDSKKRFSDRVSNYVKYRPGYPGEVLEYLETRGINGKSVVADMGAGTGIFSSLLVERVGRLYGVEPNGEMRARAESVLSRFPVYRSVAAPAEATGLPGSTLDAIVAAQAFHWFDRDACAREFRRILKPGGIVLLLWNNRLADTPFLAEYDGLLHRLGSDYSSVNHQNLTDEILADFLGKDYEKRSFANSQNFDLDGFLGRVFSSSYTPSENSPGYEPFKRDLEELFRKHCRDGKVRFDYRTEVYSGRL